jgi:hypothetical protein
MGAKRVRIPCPNCRNRLHIRVEDLGRKGECRYCGHRFRPRVKHTVEQIGKAQGGREARRLVAGQERWAGGGEPSEEDLGVDLVDEDQIVVRFEDVSADTRPPAAHPAVLAQESTFGVLAAATAAGGRFELAGTGTDMFQFQGEMPAVATASSRVTSAAEIAEQVARLVFERDEAQTECVRLRHAIELLQAELGQQLSEVARLRKSAERLKAVRAERDRLNAERAMLVREAADLHARLVETQVTLVEVEEELEEAHSTYERTAPAVSGVGASSRAPFLAAAAPAPGCDSSPSQAAAGGRPWISAASEA